MPAPAVLSPEGDRSKAGGGVLPGLGGAATLPAAARPARYYRGHRVRQVASGGLELEARPRARGEA